MPTDLHRLNSQSLSLPDSLASEVARTIDAWELQGKVRRLWAKDAALWTGKDEANWLGWLDIVTSQRQTAGETAAFARNLRDEGFAHCVLLGMGGSSLCPEVMAETFGRISGYPKMHVLDSTDPAQVASLERKLDLAHTLFVVASKSGSTLEPNVFKQHFFERVRATVGDRAAGGRFIAITDPGSKMQQVAEADGFRRVFFGTPSVGGRFSALSEFGVVPAAVMGVDVEDFLARADAMVRACGSDVPATSNPAVVLGATLGVLTKLGRDKLTIVASPGIYDLGAWLEQLVAESTGKEGKAIIPVDRETLGEPNVYGDDRLFVYLRLATGADAAQDAAVQRLERAGLPLVKIAVEDVRNLGQEFFRWEFATAVAGSLLGINPFDQPDVEASKIETRKLTSEYEETGSLPAESPFFEAEGLRLFADEWNAAALRAAAGANPTLTAVLRAHLSRIRARDYFAVLAYIEMNCPHETELQTLRHSIRDHLRVATCLGFGPRFLHSTGQAYKGGPDTGVFLQVTCDDAVDFPVPGQKFTFGVVKAAQARGDFQVLADRGRRALRLHLGSNVEAGLATLRKAVETALG